MTVLRLLVSVLMQSMEKGKENSFVFLQRSFQFHYMFITYERNGNDGDVTHLGLLVSLGL